MRALSPVLALASCLSAGSLLAQVTTTLTLTPGANAISVASNYGLVSGGGAGGPSGITQWTGMITVRLDDAFHPTTLTILSANLVAQNSGNWNPGLGGMLAAAPGNYAFFYTGSQNQLSTAIRGMGASLNSSPLSLAGSAGGYSFSPAGTTFATSGRVDHRAGDGGGGFANSFSVAPADVATASGALTLDGSALSLQLPLDSTFSVTLTTASGGVRGGVTFHLTGTLNATGVIPEPSTWALCLAGAAWLGLAARRRARAGSLPPAA